MKLCPARIQNGEGAWMTNANTTTFDNKTAEFLSYSTNIAWYAVNETTAINHPNTIKWMVGNVTMMISRIKIIGAGLNYSVIGRVRKF